jgi:hypothetical protein
MTKFLVAADHRVLALLRCAAFGRSARRRETFSSLPKL